MACSRSYVVERFARPSCTESSDRNGVPSIRHKDCGHEEKFMNHIRWLTVDSVGYSCNDVLPIINATLARGLILRSIVFCLAFTRESICQSTASIIFLSRQGNRGSAQRTETGANDRSKRTNEGIRYTTRATHRQIKKGRTVFWPTDLLPQTIPTAEIYTGATMPISTASSPQARTLSIPTPSTNSPSIHSRLLDNI
ncbi:hypothetical protein P152DRAFT_282758 [Eremomyces bilateralis CBS 781.70]|uniref:Uncharacterized protein n=1 Tax=Eremomyces bilateralis CBS 781.70 TaxID=1392243 RepID=A0A6G1G9F8_9PEZI|nr:uncharacterized protein P152DRAFT_282758 [Eremomyces bilateralis CBS 781.70]KAF1814653.1 hypothetical protein P152DRAFT_282758 [Eremomyces bilateralis CBS 781.70]